MNKSSILDFAVSITCLYQISVQGRRKGGGDGGGVRPLEFGRYFEPLFHQGGGQIMTTISPRISETSYGPFEKRKHWGFKGFTELMSTPRTSLPTNAQRQV